jgi:hypothetical protein
MYHPLRIRFAASAALAVAGSTVLSAQGTPDPHAVQPERPTVATHAHTVAPGWVEVESGVELDDLRGDARQLSTPTALKVGLTSHAQLNLGIALLRLSGRGLPSRTGVGDLLVGVKWRLLDNAPLLGDFAVLPSLKLATGSARKGTGTGTTDVGMLLISSHDFGPVALDVNGSYVRRGGDGARVPRTATLWTVSSGFPLHGAVGAVAELFGLPGTSGPAGAGPSVALLTGPTLLVRPWLAVDAGVIRRLQGPQPNAVYAGLVYNAGHLPTAGIRPPATSRLRP